MAAMTKIEWTDVTWNPVSGCSKISSGCLNCYAERMAKRLKAMGVPRYENGFSVTLHRDLIDLPKKWKQPHLVFVNSMSDLFHEDIPEDFIRSVFDTMAHCSQHIFQILTKRSGRLREIAGGLSWTENIWIGVSVENECMISRIHDLSEIPGAVKFLSCEPLLGPIPDMPLDNIDWVIVGGESGPYARPMRQEWVESILLQCRKSDIPFFFKQWGGTRKKSAGRMLNNHTYDEMPIRRDFEYAHG